MENVLDTSNVSYTIKQNAHAMHVLSSSLYKRPEEAVVRELVCNALDATVAADSEYPVVVSFQFIYENAYYNQAESCANNEIAPGIPGLANEPGKFFVVYDRGLGLSAEDTKELVTVYFGSSKSENSPNQTGFFGLGAKSPFAVSDYFYVASRWYGSITVFKAYKDLYTGMPRMDEVYKGETKDANGLTFAVPFEPKERAVRAAMLAIPHKKVRLGEGLAQWSVSHDIIGKGRTIFSGANGHLVDAETFHGSGSAYLVRYKNVAYDCKLLISGSSSFFNESYSGYGVTHILDIPSDVVLDIAPSREELRDTANNKTVIKSVFAKFNAEVLNKFIEITDITGTPSSIVAMHKANPKLINKVNIRGLESAFKAACVKDYENKLCWLSNKIKTPSDVEIQDSYATKVFSASASLANIGLVFITEIPKSYCKARATKRVLDPISKALENSDCCKNSTNFLFTDTKEHAHRAAASMKLEKYVVLSWKEDLLKYAGKTIYIPKKGLGKIKVYEGKYTSKFVLKPVDATNIQIEKELWAFTDTSKGVDRVVFLNEAGDECKDLEYLARAFPAVKYIDIQYMSLFDGPTLGDYISNKAVELSAKYESLAPSSMITIQSGSGRAELFDKLKRLKAINSSFEVLDQDLKAIYDAIDICSVQNAAVNKQLSDVIYEYESLARLTKLKPLKGKDSTIDITSELDRLAKKVGMLQFVNYYAISSSSIAVIEYFKQINLLR